MKKINTYLTSLGLFYVAAMWGSTFIVIKSSLPYISPNALNAYRFLLAAIILGIILTIQQKPLFKNLKEGTVLGVILCCVFAAQTFGVQYTSATNAGFLSGLFIVFTPLLSLAFFKQKLSLKKVISIIVSITGLWILSGGLKNINTGDILIILAALFFATYLLISNNFIKKEIDPYVISFQQFLFVGILSVSLGFLFKSPLTLQSSIALWAIIFLAIFPTLSAYIIQLVAQKTTTPFKIALIFTTQPLFSALFACVLGGEQFLPRHAIGGILIVLAMIISELRGKQET